MPTAYTAPLVEGHVTFEAFLYRCARAMGACVTIREEPLDAPLPEALEPSPYYAQRVVEAEAEYARLRGLGEQALQDEIDAKHAAAMEAHAQAVRKCEEISQRLMAMRKAALAWTPPTADHGGLKSFMLSQIEATLEADGTPPFPPIKPTVAEVLDRAPQDVIGSRALLKEEIERTDRRNAWLRALRASVAPAGEGTCPWCRAEHNPHDDIWAEKIVCPCGATMRWDVDEVYNAETGEENLYFENVRWDAPPAGSAK